MLFRSHKADYVILAVAEVEVLRAVVVDGNKLSAGIVVPAPDSFRAYLTDTKQAL